MQDKEFAAILQDEPMQPLALVPLTEEEQVHGNWHAFDWTERQRDLQLSLEACSFVSLLLGSDSSHSTFFHSVLSTSPSPSLSAEEFLHVC